MPVIRSWLRATTVSGLAWTEVVRLKYRRKGLRYASGTTDEEWAVIEQLSAAGESARPSVLNALAAGVIDSPSAKTSDAPARILSQTLSQEGDRHPLIG